VPRRRQRTGCGKYRDAEQVEPRKERRERIHLSKRITTVVVRFDRSVTARPERNA
jgi:hypothetical protein